MSSDVRLRLDLVCDPAYFGRFDQRRPRLVALLHGIAEAIGQGADFGAIRDEAGIGYGSWEGKVKNTPEARQRPVNGQ